ncbi:DUF2177 family protein [Hansschlegelia plantiphila]|uniref:Membrane protein n=1 Tax=Hansschlegelia plantiphila TaxID=374655 RepID=A0A9W6IZY0_9HYPH|nr:DUF2177 family protein [Hansschlegelia plantiphila]GLK66878.1 membrane protein [Hansschlegelia plantiphila]
MTRWIVAYFAAAAVFLAGDFLWLGFVARGFYRAQLGGLMAPQPNIAAAVAFYALYVLGVVYFAIGPAFATGAWSTALLTGLFFGLIAYATYDLTNLATLRDWPAALSVVDMAWGALLTAVSATAGFLIAKALTAA